VHLDSFVARDNIFGLAGRRAGVVFFARHQDSFIVTRNFTAVYLDLVPSHNFTVTQYLLPFTGTGKKQGTAIRRLAERHLIKPLGR
jgi:glycogen debranching enzyme